MRSRSFRVRLALVVLGVMTVAVAAGCPPDDTVTMSWFNNHPVAVKLRIEGDLVSFSGGNGADAQTIAPGETRKTASEYKTGHYEYMVNEAASGKGIVCEGRLDLNSGHQRFETIPVSGGTTYEAPGGGMCN